MQFKLGVVEHCRRIASTLEFEGSCTVLIPDGENARQVFDLLKQFSPIPVFAVVSRTGRTLHVGIATEDTTRLGWNQRLNVKAQLRLAEKTAAHEPERVFK